MCIRDRPKPVQDPHIPLWIAGGGEQLTLNVAARNAQYTNFGGASPEEFTHKSEVLKEHCDDVGRPFGEITRSVNFNVICAESEAEVQEGLDRAKAHFVPFVGEDRAQKMLETNFLNQGMAGTPEQLVEALSRWGDVGMDYAIVYFPDAAYDTTSLELFARAVIPEMS